MSRVPLQRVTLVGLLVIVAVTTVGAQIGSDEPGVPPSANPSLRLPALVLWPRKAELQTGLPDYPTTAIAAARSGRVEMELSVGEDGRLLHWRVAKSAGEDLDRAAVTSARTWRLPPLIQEGQAKAFLTYATIDYRLNGGKGRVTAHLETPPPRPSVLVGPASKSSKSSPTGIDVANFFDADDPQLQEPTVFREVKPSYTENALRAKVVGEVAMRIFIERDGGVAGIQITKPLRPDLDKQAVLAASYWRFHAAMKDGVPVPVFADLILSFNLH